MRDTSELNRENGVKLCEIGDTSGQTDKDSDEALDKKSTLKETFPINHQIDKIS